MVEKLPFPYKKNLLLFKLLAAFFAVIVLLVSFNVISYTYFSNNIQQEIIRYNTQNLTNTVERYENHLQIIQGAVTRLFFNQKVLLLNELGHSEQFDPVNQVVEEIQNILRNEQLYLDNLIILYEKNGFVVERNGPSQLNQMFGSYYSSKDYSPEFWRSQLLQNYKSKVFPQSVFKLSSSNSSANLIPVIFKSKVNDEFYIAAMLNANQLFTAFHNSVNNRFYIADASGQILYHSNNDPLSTTIMSKLGGGRNELELDGNYYFYHTSTISGLTYINVIPNTTIAEGMSQLNLVLIALLLGAVLISIVVSVVVSFKFNSPIQAIISSIQRTAPDSSLRSKIVEFNVIHNKINQMMKTNQDISLDLNRKNSELKQLGYIRMVKEIHPDTGGLTGANKPFYMIVFHLTMQQAFHELTSEEQTRAVYYLKEFISISIAEVFGDTITLQMEKNQILSLIFMEEEYPAFIQHLERLKQLFDNDKSYCCLTIAVNPVLYRTEQFASAYKLTSDMTRQRLLNDETQIITRWTPPQTEIVWFLPAHEQEFIANLQAAQGQQTIAIVTRLLQRMEKKEAWQLDYVDLAREIVDKTVRTLAAMNLDISPMLGENGYNRQLEGFTSVQQYIAFFEHFLTNIVNVIMEKREDHDAILAFLLDYASRHYNEDMSLETVADKLSLSSGYVSKYFKEKTGSNFSDFLNELRIQKAKELLQYSNCKIQDVASQVGYFNVNSFIRMFRKVTGIPPGEYRRMNLIPMSTTYDSAFQQDA